MWPHFEHEPYVDWFFRKLSEYPRLAHHPTCACFDTHLLRIGSFSVCLGCFCLGCGVAITIGMLSVGHVSGHLPEILTTPWAVIPLGVILYSPSLIQPFCQAKLVKAVSRTGLGSAIVLLFYGGLVLLPWSSLGLALKVCFLLVFVWVFRWTLRFRERFTPSPLISCIRGRYPFCEGNRWRLEHLLEELRTRCQDNDPAFVCFAEGLICGGENEVEVEHIMPSVTGDFPDGVNQSRVLNNVVVSRRRKQ